MTIEYSIRIGANGVTVVQRIEPDGALVDARWLSDKGGGKSEPLGPGGGKFEGGLTIVFGPVVVPTGADDLGGGKGEGLGPGGGESENLGPGGGESENLGPGGGQSENPGPGGGRPKRPRKRKR
jgi:hypothetical protein